MNTQTIRLGYMSTAKRLLNDNELQHLLNNARSRNTAMDITGMLLYSDGSFLQILEGPYNNVHRVLKSIKLDPKHYQINTLFEMPIEERYFKEWTMGFKQAKLTELSQVPGCNDLLHEDSDLEKHIIKDSDAGSTLEKIMMFFKSNASPN